MAGIARTPWAAPKELYGLFDQAYPQPKDGSRRSAPFVPYLAYVPDDFALSLCFAGGGVCGADLQRSCILTRMTAAILDADFARNTR